MRDAPGRRIAGRYELIERAGEGGMATVWRAATLGAHGFSRPVALKRALPSLASSPEFVEMFVEEARVHASLDHPNIVHVHDFGQDEHGELYLVMEWVDGLDLRTFVHAHDLEEDHVDWEIVAAIGLEVLRGLHFAHTRRLPDGRPSPVFHRDITPQNVMLGAHGSVKVADFGLARAMDRARITSPGMLKGKIAYLAPELVEDATPTAKSDVFGVGIVLWEALAGEKLFDAPTDRDVIARVMRADVPPIQDIRDDVSDAVAEVVHVALARDPADRWADARAMGSALARALRELPELVDAHPIAEQVHDMRRRLARASRSIAPRGTDLEQRRTVAAALHDVPGMAKLPPPPPLPTFPKKSDG
jgi:eukaryotic-like serine/threonine-protein kinase